MLRHLKSLLIVALIAGCAGSTGVMVKGAGPDDLLKLRKGPGLHHEIILGLPDGTRLTRHACAQREGKLWCRVSLTDKPAVIGYVSADYLALR